jgi:hypothetical protein
VVAALTGFFFAEGVQASPSISNAGIVAIPERPAPGLFSPSTLSLAPTIHDDSLPLAALPAELTLLGSRNETAGNVSTNGTDVSLTSNAIFLAQSGSLPAPAVDENFLTMGGVLDPHISFSRASSATLVGKSGLIQTVPANGPRFDYSPATLALNGLLLEGSTTNQQLDSNFDIFTGGIDRWYAPSALLTLNSALAPDGTATAAKITDDSADTTHGVYYSNGAFPAGINPGIPFFDWPVGGPQAESCSMFFKAGTLGFGQLQLYENASGAGVAVDIDLRNGELGNPGTIGSGSTYLGSTITAYPSGFYRVSVSGIIPNPHNLSCIPLTEDSLGDVSYAGSGGTIIAWGADVENMAFPTSYLYTASIPNLQLDSNNLANWNSGGEGISPGCGNGIQCNSVLTVNAATAPDGTLTAAQLADNGADGNHLMNHTFGLGGPGLITTINQYYATVTCSEFLKAGTQGYAQLQCGTEGSSHVNDEANSGISVDIDLLNGTIANGGTYGVTGSDQTSYLSSDVEALPNAEYPSAPAGWYRVSVTGIVIVEADVHIQPLLASSLGTISYAGTGSTIFIWGPQVEQHQTPTLSNYIPVGEIPLGETSRAPEIAIQPLVGGRLHLPNFASGLSWVLSGITASGVLGTQVVAELDDSSASNAITLERAPNGHLQFLIVSGGITQVTLDLGAVADRTPFRAGINAKGGSFAASINGGSLVADTGAMPARLTTARYGSDTSGDYWDGWVRESELWAPAILSNSRLQAATTRAP